MEEEEIIKSSKSTGCGSEPMPSKLIKWHLDVLLPLITRMVNHSLTAGVFNDSWKTSIIKSLLKKEGKDRVLRNFRPVNNLSFMSKIVEKVLLVRFNNHCEINNFIPDYVSVHRSGYSTETVLLRLSDEILQNMDRQCITPLVAVDLSTAFDTVEHRILKDLLHRKYSVTGTALKWYVSYLGNRTVKVQINESTSSVLELTTSVSQGSVSGPVLYNCYASTLKDYLEESCNDRINLLGYADDHATYSQFRAGVINEEITCQHHLENVLAEIKIWMNRNFMKMNYAKTEYTKFGNKRKLLKCTGNDIPIRRCYSTSISGFKLPWSLHG